MPKKDYEVGYGKPPKHSQFVKGKSGNPAGRPARSTSGINRISEALENMYPTESKIASKLSVYEKGVLRLFHNAAKGDKAALKKAIGLLIEARREQPEEFLAKYGVYLSTYS